MEIADLERTTKKEVIATAGFSLLIFAYPIFVIIALILNAG